MVANAPDFLYVLPGPPAQHQGTLRTDPLWVARTVATQLSGERVLAYRQPQPPPQQPPLDPAPLAAPPPAWLELVIATVESNLTVSAWPTGQLAGSLAALIGRLTSKVAEPLSWAHSRQRNS